MLMVAAIIVWQQNNIHKIKKLVPSKKLKIDTRVTFNCEASMRAYFTGI